MNGWRVGSITLGWAAFTVALLTGFVGPHGVVEDHHLAMAVVLALLSIGCAILSHDRQAKR